MHPQNLGGRGSEQTLFQLCNQLTAHGVIGLVAKSVQLFGTLCTVVHQAPLSVGFSRQEHWSGLPRPPPGDLPDQGMEHMSPALQVDFSPLSHWGSPHVFKLVDKREFRKSYRYNRLMIWK